MDTLLGLRRSKLRLTDRTAAAVLAGFFPWLAALRGGATFAAQVVFGIVAASLYCGLNRTAAEL